MLHAAIRLADQGGIESLTMRKLAQALGVEAMSLYNHVANKGDLVDGIADLVVSEIELPSTAEDWDGAIRSARSRPTKHSSATPGRAPRDVAYQHPHRAYAATPVHGMAAQTTARSRFLARADVSAYHALDSHILGFTLWQLGHAAAAKDLGGGRGPADFAAAFLRELRAGDYPHLAEHVEQHLTAPSDDGGREFEFGLNLILDGLKRARGIT